MYTMYENPQTDHLFPVKSSFQWMAFLTPANWAWVRGMANLGWIYFILSLFLAWLVIPAIIQAIYAGVKAGEHHAKLLQQNGYEDRGSVMALSEFDAIQKYHDTRTSGS